MAPWFQVRLTREKYRTVATIEVAPENVIRVGPWHINSVETCSR